MQHPYITWKPGYETLLASMVIERKQTVDAVCGHILDTPNWSRYSALEHETGIPAAFVGALDYRESNCNPHLGLGQGDPWDRVSTHIPRGCGPFPSWLDAALFYVRYDHLADHSAPWSLAYECWKGEIWNGLGYRYHGKPSTYLWGGTNIQQVGKFTSDGHWDGQTFDVQIGIMPIIVQLGKMRPELAQLFTSDAPSIEPPTLGGGSGIIHALWVQETLNKIGAVPPELAPLRTDGNYGRRTREAVRAFQRTHGLTPDGLCGPKTAVAMMQVPEHA